jgi:hypothetical protein
MHPDSEISELYFRWHRLSIGFQIARVNDAYHRYASAMKKRGQLSQVE